MIILKDSPLTENSVISLKLESTMYATMIYLNIWVFSEYLEKPKILLFYISKA